MRASIVDAIIEQLEASLVYCRAPLLIGTFGLPGSGKTAVAHWLAARYPLIVLSTDTIRLHYDLPSGPATVDAMYEVAATLLPRNAGIIFDGIHMRRSDRTRLQAFATHYSVHSALLYVTADREIIDARLAARQRNTERTRAEGKFVITQPHFARIASWLEVPTEQEDVWRIDTTDSLAEEQLTGLINWLDNYV